MSDKIDSRIPLSNRQGIVLSYIKKQLKENLKSPTIQEVADYLGVSKSTACQHIIYLHKKGYITRYFYKTRGIIVV